MRKRGGRGGDGLVSDPVVFFAVADFVLLPLLLTPISPDWGLSAPWKHMPHKAITSIPPFPTKAHFLQLSSHLPSSFPTHFPVGPSCFRSQSLFCIVLCPPYSSSVYSCFSFLCHFNSISLFSLTDQRDSLVMWLKTPLPRDKHTLLSDWNSEADSISCDGDASSWSCGSNLPVVAGRALKPP